MNKFRFLETISRLFCGICFAILLSACGLIPGGLTPEDAVRKTFSSQGFQIAGARKIDKGVILLYHKPQPEIIRGDPENLSYQLGYSFVDQRNGRWWTRSGQSGSFTPEQGSKVIFLVSLVQTSDQDPKRIADDKTAPFIIFGKILDQTIATIELVKENDQIVADIPSDSMFAFLETEGSIPCTLRFLDKQRMVIEEYNLAALGEWQISAELLKRLKLACPAQP